MPFPPRINAVTSRPAPLRLTALEDRVTPAAFGLSGADLALDLDANNTGLTVASAGATYTLTLSVGTWTSPDIAGATGSGTNVLTVTADAFPALRLTDSATGSTVNFSGTGLEYSDDFSVTLDDSPGAVFFTGTATAFGSSDLSVTTSNAVVLNGAGVALTAVTGDIALAANGQAAPTAGNLDGIGVSGGARIQVTGSGSLLLSGRGGTDASGAQLGVAVFNGGQVIGGTGAVSITGTGGTSAGNQNFGVYIDGSSEVTSTGGSVAVVGTGGGTGASSQNAGLFIGGGSQLSAGGTGTVSVAGTGGPAGGGDSNGVTVGSAAITSLGGGAVSVAGTAGTAGVGIRVGAFGAITTATNGGDLALIADSFDLPSGATVAAAAANAVTLAPLTAGLGIDLGGAGGVPALSLTDADLDGVTAGTLRLGQAGTGAIVITAPITRSASTDVVLTGSSATGAVAGTDLDLAGGTLSFGPGTALASAVAGTVPDVGYDQLSVAGSAALSGAGLILSGPLVPAVGTVFDLVAATGGVSGSFAAMTTTLNGVTLRTGTTAATGFVAMPVPAATGIPAQTIGVGDPPINLNLTAFFADPATPLVYTVVGNTDPAAASAAVSGSTLTLTGLAAGPTAVTVRMTDANGRFVESTFTLTVTAPVPAPPLLDPPPVLMPTPVPPTPVKLSAAGAGAGGGPAVKAFAADGSLTLSFLAYDPAFGGGVRVATGDVTGDGVDDLVTAPGAGGGPHVKVFDGADGHEVASFFAYGSGFSGGVFVAAADVTGDGYADVITGAGAGGGPHVKVFDGRTFAEVRSFFAYDGSVLSGVTVGGGDLDGDGFADIVTGAGAGGGPHVKAFGGRDGALLLSFFAYTASFTGGVWVAAGDLDGDGRAELVTGAGAGGGPEVRVFGGDGQPRGGFTASDPTSLAGVRVAVWGGRIATAPPFAGGTIRTFAGGTLAPLSALAPFSGVIPGGLFVG